jgi:hypothetical protein
MGLCHYAAYLLIVASSVACLPIVVQRSSSSTCGPAGWEDIVFFYLLNYGAHAMTVVNLPGECDLVSLIWATLALLLPYSGIIKACTSIAYALPRSKDPLRRALFAGALGEVVEKTDKWPQRTRKIHGRAHLPPGYSIRPLSRDVRFMEFDSDFNKISSSDSRVKGCVAICQLLFSCFTLYHTRGNQIELYGYAAYGLTVIPYAIMSLVNLIATLLTPHYSTMFMVRTQAMLAAEEAGGRFEGVVATVEASQDNRQDAQDFRPGLYGLSVLIGIMALIAPYIILKVLTGFETGGSTTAQRVWTMTWLVFGQFVGFGAALTVLESWKLEKLALDKDAVISVVYIFTFATGAIGGFVVVGQMLVVHGNCSSAITS